MRATARCFPPRRGRTHSPIANDARGLVLGAMYDAQGLRVASVAQEGLVRLPR